MPMVIIIVLGTSSSSRRALPKQRGSQRDIIHSLNRSRRDKEPRADTGVLI